MTYNFPTQLFPGGEPQRMFFDDDSMGFGNFPEDTAIFYSISDGNWSDQKTWDVVGTGATRLPTSRDVVYVRHNVTVNNSFCTCYNLFISGYLYFFRSFQITLTVTGNINSIGVIDMTSGGTINVYGLNNYIKTLMQGAGAIIYQSQFRQPICQVDNYYSVAIFNSTKYLTKDLILDANLFGLSLLDLMNYDLTVGGNTNFTGNTQANPGIIKEFEGGKAIFITGIVIASAFFSFVSAVIEFRGGLDFYNGTYNLTGSPIRFTTNDQRFNVRQIFIPVKSLLVENITVTNESFFGFVVNDNLNGTTAGSTWINKGGIYFNTTTLPMITGVFDYLTYSSSELGYVMDGDYTLPYTSYQSIYIGGTGIKKFSSAPTILNSIRIVSGATLDIEGYDLTVPGTTLIVGILKRSVAGTVNIFIGLLTVGGNISIGGSLDVGTGLIELRGGLSGGSITTFSIDNDLVFSTNNQNVDGNNVNLGSIINLNGSILISGAIAVTIGNHLSGFSTANITNNINGDNASSTFINKIFSTSGRGLHYTGTTQPMATGVLDCSSFSNWFFYDLNGDQEVKGTTYYNLTFGGSGVKKLMGDVTVTGTYSLTGTATVDTNGFTFTHP